MPVTKCHHPSPDEYEGYRVRPLYPKDYKLEHINRSQYVVHPNLSPYSTMALPDENPIVLNLGNSFGVILIGNVLSFVLWGVVCMQAYVHVSQMPL